MTESVNRIIYHESFYKQYGEGIEKKDKYREGQGVAGKNAEDKLYKSIMKVAPEVDPLRSGRISFDQFSRIALRIFDTTLTEEIPADKKELVAKILKSKSLPVWSLSPGEIESIMHAGLGNLLPKAVIKREKERVPLGAFIPASRQAQVRVALKKQFKAAPPVEPKEENNAAALSNSATFDSPSSTRKEKNVSTFSGNSTNTIKESEPSTFRKIINFLFGWMF
jgi:hypothetical protein